MSSIRFSLVLHDHQPLGNFGFVVEDAYQMAYLPFLEVLERHPAMRVGMHHSGVLLTRLESTHPEYIDRLGALVDSGRVELLTGGFHEPIYTAIAEQDLQDQIAHLTERLHTRFGVRPRCAWVTERVWEPRLAPLLREVDVDQVLLDDHQFHLAGLAPDVLWRPWITPTPKGPLRILPIARSLRYAVPFKPIEAAMQVLQEASLAEPGGVAVLGDDGEKFGVWPRTHRRVYQDGWLDAWFSAICEADWVIPVTPSEVEGGEQVHLPPASYPEMMEWCLPVEEQERLARTRERLRGVEDVVTERWSGGIWAGFLTRYSESNHLHKRGQDLALLARETGDATAGRENLLAAQCNCGYWHGVFGGIYLPHLRDAIHRELLAAESHILSSSAPQVEARDYDGDGNPEYFLTDDTLTAVVSPADGGSLREWSHRPARACLTGALTRRREAYHAQVARAVVADPDELDEDASIHDLVLAKEPGLEHHLVEDVLSRASLRDRFLRHVDDLAAVRAGDAGDTGDFAGGAYQVVETLPDGIRLRRDGVIWQRGDAIPIRVDKTITRTGQEAGLRVRYRLDSLGETPVSTVFAVELNLGLLDGTSDQCGYRFPGGEDREASLGTAGVTPNLSRLDLEDGHRNLRLQLAWSPKVTLLRYPVETVTQSERGFERIHQAACVMAARPIRLSPGRGARFSVTLSALRG